MKHSLTIFFVCFANFIWAQTNTEVYLFHLGTKNDSIILLNKINISNNEGYDNQPSFLDNNTVLFSSTRNGQTDIARYHIKNNTLDWISNTLGGSEYSPLKIPSKDEVSAIRLDTSGLQRLYRYDISTGESNELLKDLKVGYHVWYNDHIVVSTVLMDDRMDLVVSDLKNNTSKTIAKNVGRSLHKIPKSDLVSYISKEKEEWTIKSLNPVTGTTQEITYIFPKSEDICWLKDGSVLMAQNNFLLNYNPLKNKKWFTIWHFNDNDISEVSRMAISPNGSYLAVVSEK